jgi:TRAP-type uncharacterized transport system fused permease subunit
LPALLCLTCLFTPYLLMIGSTTSILLATFTAIIGVLALSAGGIGYMNKPMALWERAILIASALTLIKGGWETDLIGFALLAVVIFTQHFFTSKGDKQEAPAS